MFEALSDDQTALLGCLAALLTTGTLMSLSFYLGRNGREESARTNGDVLPLTGSPTRPADAPQPASHKRAA